RSHFAELPTEILDNIFECLWYIGLRNDDYLGDSNADRAMAKRIQCREYASVLLVSKRCCAVAQRLIYTRMTIVDRYAMLRFMRRAMDENRPQIREFIQHINFSIEPISNSQARFRFKPRYGEVLDEIAARDFRERDNIDEA